MCVPFTRGYGSLRGANKVVGRELAWWKKEAPLYWPYCFYSLKPDAEAEGFRKKEQLDKDVTVFTEVTLAKDADKAKVFDWQAANGNINLNYDVGDPLESVKEYAKRIKGYRKDGSKKDAKFALASNCFTPEQYGVEKSKLEGFLPDFDALAVRSDSKWGMVYGAMAWHDLLEDKQVKRDLILIGPLDCSLIPVVAYLKKLWHGDVYFKQETRKNKMEYWFRNGAPYLVNYERPQKADFPCACPFCRVLRENALEPKDFEAVVNLHNLYITLGEWWWWAWLLKNDPKEFGTLAKSKGFYSYISFIDSSVQWGWKRAIKTLWYVSLGG